MNGTKICFSSQQHIGVQESSRLTPNLIMLGRETRQPVDLLYKIPNSPDNICSNVGEYVT